ncbi:uncharacterized protein F4812DRAFT_415870 [Daldinia caldariorum]|uniref:uncharacterized protein n=1 Tax=Daldinia caldariorum TaxID=326644 RepID=UPI00200795E0|nr:uncharacterized protein F4812DRAFT_415870 [Daldinia caldariorum]KAI1471876.1 hypothetical protein F4812DRAFT_415870 [Daldinia caldariorum]
MTALNEPHKTRIISHMNADHYRELEHYLRAFNGLPASAARGAQLTDMTTETMTIRTASGATHSVSIKPPLASAAEARVRLVDMATEALQKLGLSDIRISTITPPRGIGAATFIGVSLYVVCVATLPLVRPSTAAWAFLDQYFPFGGVARYFWVVRAILVPTVVLHLFEAWWMARSRLTKHGVDAYSKLWLLWIADTLMEGYPAMVRFDGLVKTERKKKEGGKH